MREYRIPTDSNNESEEPIDATLRIIAPENVDFMNVLAGPFERSIAYFIDCAVLVAYLIISFIVFESVENFLERHIIASFSELTAFLFYFNLTFGLWFWNAFFEALWNGRTIGKVIMGLRVLTVSGRPISLGQAILRNVLRLADLMLGPFVVFVMGANVRMARLGDLAAGTIVVVKKKSKNIKSSFSESELKIISALVEKLPKDLNLSESTRRTLTLYASRRMEIISGSRKQLSIPLVGLLLKKYRMESVLEAVANPDLFLCALYQRSLGDDSRLDSIRLRPN